MALTAAQLALTAEIVRESYTDVETAADELNAAQETLLVDDLDVWEAIRDSHVKLKGGSDGVDFDNARKRAAIFYRIRNMLGFPYTSFDLSESFFELVQLEVGSSFG